MIWAIIANSETLKAGSSLLAAVIPKISKTYAATYMTIVTITTTPDVKSSDSEASTPGRAKIDTITAKIEAASAMNSAITIVLRPFDAFGYFILSLLIDRFDLLC